jgi:hypothetical protein
VPQVTNPPYISPYKFQTKPYKCRCGSREIKAATPEQRESQHVALTGLGAICNLCHGPVKDAKDD